MNILNFFTFLILISIIINGINAEYAPIVETKEGKIRGIVNTVGIWTKSYIYQGIRYATSKRFAKPKRIDKFNEEIYDATYERNSCPQFLSGFGNLENHHKLNKHEDCLFLNIYKPIPNVDDESKLLPVMVWIYGGGFQCGTIFFPLYDGTYLVNYGDVIVVSINYRVGPFGFLYSGTDDAPGNQGFYDQIMALEWIRDNIQNFGGDHNQVTIFGESAGSFSVSALILSPLSKGLFKRAIMQSGSFAPVIRTSGKEQSIEKTIKLANDLNCKENEMSKIIECLQNKSMEEIVEAATNDVAHMITGKMIFPIIDDFVIPEEVLTENFCANGPIDIMFGITRDEGSMFVAKIFPELDDDQNKISENRTREIIREILSHFNINDYKEIEDFYMKRIDTNNFNQIRQMLNHLFGDLRINCPTYLFVKKMARLYPENNFYAYRFDRRSLISDMMNCKEWMGVCHASELLYVFSNSMMSMYQSDSQLSIDMMNSWTKFGKTGDPSPMGSLEWPKFLDNSNNETKWMIMDIEHRIEHNLLNDVCETIWSKHYDKKVNYHDDNNNNNKYKDEL